MTSPVLPIPSPELRHFLMGESSEERWYYWSQHATGLLINEGHLKPDGKILDIGCGAGRTAIGLARYLAPSGCYEGFDACRQVVSWCQENLAGRLPNFRFTHADIKNSRYNPDGTLPAETYTFPYEDAHFDAAYLGSVFTHMVPEAVIKYLSEIRRVLRPGGRVVATFFMVPSTLQSISPGNVQIMFPLNHGFWRNMNLGNPDEGTAYTEDFLRTTIHDSGLRLLDPIRYGSWSGAKGDGVFQDTITSEKPV